ncbi:hypothetical protein F5B20DRAFT_288155 [Whalleya microplaca]|nr:hypothetical protein F5B20DRAFT_288155 [Whalleya microplaca]
MPHEHVHHFSKDPHRRRRKHQHNEEEENVPQKPKDTTATANGSQYVADFAWSTPVLDSEGGFNYQARLRPDGTWEYAISGASAGAAVSYLRYPPSETQEPTSYDSTAFATPYISVDNESSQVQDTSSYTRLHQHLAVEEYENEAINITAAEPNSRRPGRVPIRITVDFGSDYEATYTRERSTTRRSGTFSRRRDSRRYGEQRHVMRTHGDGHGRRENEDRVDAIGDEDINSADQVNQWIEQPTYD